jgi:hypothetical protein
MAWCSESCGHGGGSECDGLAGRPEASRLRASARAEGLRGEGSQDVLAGVDGLELCEDFDAGAVAEALEGVCLQGRQRGQRAQGAPSVNYSVTEC